MSTDREIGIINRVPSVGERSSMITECRTIFTFFTSIVDAITGHECLKFVHKLKAPDPQKTLPEVVDGDGTIKLPKYLTGTPPSLESAKIEDVGKSMVRSETRTKSTKSLVLLNSTTEEKKKKIE
ncbi:hypothetical protein Tco_0242929 [Tanacetum coccineum]